MLMASDLASMTACRLLTGSDAYERVHQALTDRLTALEAQRDVACSADIDA